MGYYSTKFLFISSNSLLICIISLFIELEILYNYYYENKTSDENNYSVCFMLRRGEEQFLFTGDLEEKGEELIFVKDNTFECVASINKFRQVLPDMILKVSANE